MNDGKFVVISEAIVIVISSIEMVCITTLLDVTGAVNTATDVGKDAGGSPTTYIHHIKSQTVVCMVKAHAFPNQM